MGALGTRCEKFSSRRDKQFADYVLGLSETTGGLRSGVADV